VKHFLLLCALLLSLGISRSMATSQFEEGIEAFEAGKFPQAANAFRASLKEQSTPDTFLNLGLTEWRRGRAGAAILAWEQALWLDPTHKAASENLEFAREVKQLDLPDFAWHELPSTWLPANYWAWLAFLTFWSSVAMVILPTALRWRKASWHQGVAALSFGLFLLTIPAQFGVASRSHIGVILERKAPLRLTPTDDAEHTFTLDAGETARRIRTRDDFVYVRSSHGSGWVKQKEFGLICGF
jgi:tetratricopeptide (TPR) repeat protein